MEDSQLDKSYQNKSKELSIYEKKWRKLSIYEKKWGEK
jgi:hypothetical protein